MGRRIVAGAALVFALFALPRQSDAGLLEFIWEMSGPRMLGLGYGCLFTTKMKLQECRLGSASLMVQEQQEKMLRKAQQDPTAKQAVDRVFIALGGSLLTSTSRDSDSQGYDWGEIWMLAIEPGVVVQSTTLWKAIGGPKLSHGAGISYDRLFGRDIGPFDKFGFTVTLADVAWPRVAVGVKYRLYPNGFTDDEFKPGPRLDQNRPFEKTLGFTFSYIIPQCRC